MNDRIRELLSMAGVHYEVMPKDTVYEKFAELIVQKCIDICLTNAVSKDEARWAAGVCAFDIQEHFGVD